MTKLNGKTAIVTGANSGMGLATVKALAEAGAHVIMLCRSSERGKAALDKLKDQGDYSLDLILCDLGDYSSIRAFAAEVKRKYDHLDILVNNAGFIALDRQEKMMEKYPEVEAVKNDEKRHGDTVLSLLKNGEYNDRPLLPFIVGGAAVFVLLTKISGKKGK